MIHNLKLRLLKKCAFLSFVVIELEPLLPEPSPCHDATHVTVPIVAKKNGGKCHQFFFLFVFQQLTFVQLFCMKICYITYCRTKKNYHLSSLVSCLIAATKVKK